VARWHTRLQRLAQASSNKLEERTRREESPQTHPTCDRQTPRIQSETRNCHGQSPRTTWGREEAKASFWKKAEGNGSLQIHQVHFSSESGRATGSEKISELDCTGFLSSLFGRDESLVRSNPHGPSSPRAATIALPLYTTGN
jgi:hypothetical protein